MLNRGVFPLLLGTFLRMFHAPQPLEARAWWVVLVLLVGLVALSVVGLAVFRRRR